MVITVVTFNGPQQPPKFLGLGNGGPWRPLGYNCWYDFSQGNLVSKPLTDTEYRAARKGPTRRKLSDGVGLQLWVQPSGARLWQLAGKKTYVFVGFLVDADIGERRQIF